MSILAFLAGVVVGAGGMFFVYKNNKKTFEAAALAADRKYADLQRKFRDK